MRTRTLIVVLGVAIFTLPTAISKTLAPLELWREGPVTIEAQRGQPPDISIPRIVYVDGDGVVWRDGVRIEELDPKELLDLVRDLVAYELRQSWVPLKERRRTR